MSWIGYNVLWITWKVLLVLWKVLMVLWKVLWITFKGITETEGRPVGILSDGDPEVGAQVVEDADRACPAASLQQYGSEVQQYNRIEQLLPTHTHPRIPISTCFCEHCLAASAGVNAETLNPDQH